jgi:hypothetical protein
VTDDGDNTYTVLPAYRAAVADNRDPSLSDRLAGWIPDTVTIKDDQYANDVREVDNVYAKQYANYDHVRDMMPDYVTLSAANSTAVANNNTAILNYAMQTTSKWIVSGGIDAQWEAYVKQLKGLGIDKNVKIYQAAYDKATK